MDTRTVENLEKKLNSFQLNERFEALAKLQSSVSVVKKEQQNVNLHLHSFFSYNAEFWSPARIAWEAKKRGLYAAGIVDFDVLTGLQEFLEAGEMLKLRTNVGIETRAFLNEFADREIDSPGEPGVSYIAGTGFFKLPEEGSPQAKELKKYGQKAAERNNALIERINRHVPEIALKPEDVTVLTPAGNATERHIMMAYIKKASGIFPENELVRYWSKVLEMDTAQIEKLMFAGHKFEDVVRKKFAKKGGFGYVQPSAETFPPVKDFFNFVKSCGAIPMESWLDGTSEGERDPQELLELSESKGAAALNLIPDRNWNIEDPGEKAVKFNNLKKIIETAGKMHLPLHIGTEMNKKGLPFADDLDGSDLKSFKQIILHGSKVILGHTLLGRFTGFSYTSSEAEAEFPDRKKRNGFFASVGKLPAVDTEIADTLRNAGTEKAFAVICDSAKKGNWVV